jgi:hypothetical protein
MGSNKISRRELLGRGLKIGAAAVGITLAPLIKPLENICKGDEIVYKVGKLNLYNEIADIWDKWPFWIIHRPGATDDYGTYDSIYFAPFDKPNTKVVSILETQDGKKELDTDSRQLGSFKAVNLELSVDTGGGDINISCANNLWCSIHPLNKGYNFGVKPITLWRRFPAEPDKLQFLADIREVYAKGDFIIDDDGIKYAIIPLSFMDRTYGNQVPYEFLQVRFDVYPGDIDLNGKVDMKDLHYVGKDWKKTGAPLDSFGDITGELGLPDGNVDARDLELFVRHWLKNIRDIMP